MTTVFINGPQFALEDSTGSVLPSPRLVLEQLLAQRDEIHARIAQYSKMFTWEELAHMGMTVEATKSYREISGHDLRTAYAEVSAYMLEHDING